MEQLFYNGDIITMEDPADKPEAVLVRNGIIAAVGTLAEVEAKAGADCQKADLQGNTLMPSFVDAHGHVSMTVQYMAMADLSSAESFEDIVQLMKEFQQQQDLTHGEYLFGYSYDHNFLKEQTYPTRDILDQVSAEVPVVIWHTSAHMGVANSKALEIMGIDENTPNPEGGLIARYPGTQTPNGYLEETALTPLRELQAKMKMDLYKQLEEAQMMTFDSIGTELLKAYGFEVFKCASEAEAIEKAEELKKGGKCYPVYYSISDTSGEKPFEEFVTETESADMDRFSALGVIIGKEIPDQNKISKLFTDLNATFEKVEASKEEVIAIMKNYLPNFKHIETGKNLDSKM